MRVFWVVLLLLIPIAHAAYVDNAVYEGLQEQDEIRVFIDYDDRRIAAQSIGMDPSLVVDSATLDTLSNDPSIDGIYKAGTIKAFLDESVPATGAPLLWDQSNITGAGESVCVIDTGIMADHPAILGKVIAEKCFCFPDCCPDGTAEDESAIDDNGHGTHVAGTIVSQNSTFTGMAPGANIVAVKVLNEDGAGFLLELIDGINWCKDNAALYNISVISMSLGTDAQFSQGYCDVGVTDNFLAAQAANAAADAGILVIAASGNSAQDDGISFPACGSKVISVGASYDDDLGSVTWTTSSCTDNDADNNSLACFTNIDTSTPGEYGPDILAPGAMITSTVPPLSNCTGDPASAECSDTLYSTKGGTSMAAPHVAGAAALLAQYYRTLTAEPFSAVIVKQALLTSSVQVNSSRAPGHPFPLLNMQDAKLALLTALEDQPPQLTFTNLSPSDGLITDAISINISVFVYDALNAIDTCILDWNGTSYEMNRSVLANGTICWKRFYGGTGFYTYEVSANDTLGNTNMTQTRNITLSDSPPNVTITLPSNMSVFSAPAIPVNATAIDASSAISSCTLEIYNGSASSYQSMQISPNNLSATCTTSYAVTGFGIIHLRVWANDSNGQTAPSAYTTVEANNSAPYILSSQPLPGVLLLDEGTSTQFNLTANDSKNDSISILWSVDGIVLLQDNTSSSSFILTLNYSSAGAHTLIVNATDGALHSQTGWNIIVQQVNLPPVFNATIPGQFWYVKKTNSSLLMNATVDLSLYFYDSDADSLTYTLATVPNISYSVNSDTITLSSGLEFSGNYQGFITASDGEYAVNSTNFTLRITPDQDSDGHNIDDYGGDDCDDTDAAVWIGASCVRSGYTGSTIDNSCICSGGSVTKTSKSSGGGGGGGFVVLTKQDEDSKYFGNIHEFGSYSHTIDRSGIPLAAYSFSPNKPVHGVSITIKEADYPRFDAISYFEVELDSITDEDIDHAILQVRVEANIARLFDTIVVYRQQEEGWVPLPTEFYTRDTSYWYYAAQSPGFSLFAIRGEALPEEVPVPEVNTSPKNSTTMSNITYTSSNTTEPEPKDQTQPVIESHVESPGDTNMWFQMATFGLVAFMSLLLVTVYIFRSQQHGLRMKELRSYIGERLEKGHEEEHIKKDLLDLGWHHKHVHEQFEHALNHHKFSKLENYIEERLHLGDHEEHIKKDLIDAGWHQKHVHSYTNKVKGRFDQLKKIEEVRKI